MVKKNTEDDRGRTGSIVWIVHGTQILRCAPEQLQPATRDLKGLDMEINGPFLPHDLMKGKKFYHDLLDEQKDMEHDMIEGDENAWRQDPNHFRLEHPDEPEIKRRKLQGKRTVPSQELDSVRTNHECAAGRRRGGDHELQRSSSGQPSRAGGDDRGRAQEADSSKRQALREGIREGVERGHELRQVDSSPPEERRSLEALDHIHREKGERRESKEANHKAKPTKNEDRKKKPKEMDMAQLEEELEDEDWDAVSGLGFTEGQNYQNKIQMDQMMEMFSQMLQRMEHLQTVTTQVIQHMEKITK